MVMLAVATAQQQPSAHGTIYGTVIRQDGEPARRIALEAQPLGVYVFAGVLPRTETNDAGQYRFQGLPWWDRYTVYAEDEKAGYSRISTGPAGDSHPAQVEITPQQPKAEFNFTLPRKAGFIQIKLRNRRSSEIIRGMVIEVMTMEKPDSLLFSMSCYSNHVLLVPPDRNLLLHVKSEGFREWDESHASGKPINVPSGSTLALDVQLDPAI